MLEGGNPRVVSNQMSNGNGVGLHILEGGGHFEKNEIKVCVCMYVCIGRRGAL